MSAEDRSLISLNPDKELEFHGPFTQLSRQTLIVTNEASDSPIAFKVKTTAPKKYCVRPNSGRIEPRGSMEIQILLQAALSDPSLELKSKDKFLVQAIRIPPDVMVLDNELAGVRLAELWTRNDIIKKSNPEQLQNDFTEKKIKCTIVVDSASAAGRIRTSLPPSQSQAADASFSSRASVGSLQQPTDSPANRTSTIYYNTRNSTASIPPVPDLGLRSQPSRDSIMSNKTGPTYLDTREQELKDAYDTIKQLRAACDTYKSEIERRDHLRQRKAVDDSRIAGSGHGQLAMAQKPQDAFVFSAQTVALVALISFLLGWFFF
ncbi:PapD-like protein [Polychytrium aggregatum]|uniref:PapD-like protein n=1 Tax=Polychytrium aggregatum TaxID=110093 RepID=UPI0022FE2B47|nr:PapD-like protein [Polychytrium aggregatum]KAI9203954.1 PapD-like protein [Polychytrium aggregatum]